jgi:hypothetical protein
MCLYINVLFSKALIHNWGGGAKDENVGSGEKSFRTVP